MIRDLNVFDFVYILKAAQWTLLLSLFAVVGGGVLGVALALARLARRAPLRWASGGFIQFFQATPLLMQLFLVFFGGTLIGIRFEPWTAALIAFSLYSAAYLGDIWHGSILAIPRSQWEASRALALSEPLSLLLVIAPQALKVAIPPTVGFLVQMIKSTSLASIIGFTELVRAGQFINNSTLRPLAVYGFVAAIFFLLCWPLSKYSQRLELRLAQGLRRG